jgi:hypothetical protein|tara:strand:+ start:2200 stop:3924 length:1725 start_codon:yes stop_codon:yes gene_type:complete
MSTYYTAPAIYNTGGWGTRGDTPSFNPTGIVVPTGDTGKAFLTVSRADYYFDSKRRFNFELSSSFTQLKNTILRRVNYEIDPSFNLITSQKLRSFNYSFAPSRIQQKSKKSESFSTFNLPKLNYRYRREDYFKNYRNIEEIYYIRSSIYRPRVTLSIESLINQYKDFFQRFNTYGRVSASLFGSKVFRQDFLSRPAIGASLFGKRRVYINNVVELSQAGYFSGDYKFEKFKTSILPNFHIFQKEKYNNNFKAFNTLDVQYYISQMAFKQKVDTSIKLNLFGNKNPKVKNQITSSINQFRQALSKGSSNRSINSTLFRRIKGRHSFSTSLSNIDQFKSSLYIPKSTLRQNLSEIYEIKRDLPKVKGRFSLEKINYYDIDNSEENFTKTNNLNLLNYNTDPVRKEAKISNNFPTGLHFPKIRYQTAEPNYSVKSTGANNQDYATSDPSDPDYNYGYLIYEGVGYGNLFSYEPDQNAMYWDYFDYDIRSGIFNPCEFPETADRTLDPVQISSRSNKGDNPFWYLPDLLTVDSTIHTADGAPCQYIAQENSRFAEIFLEDGQLLLPENYTQTGQLFTV